MELSNYQYKISNCIDEKLTEYAMNKPCSLYNIEILFHHFLIETSNIFYNPKEHYSKIMLIAYNNTIKEMNK